MRGCAGRCSELPTRCARASSAGQASCGFCGGVVPRCSSPRSGFRLTFLPGFLLGFAASQSSWSIALTGIIPNGLVEIPVAIIAGGLAIHIGAAVIHMEASGGWTARVLAAGADYVRALRWLVPGLIVAAVLEVRFG